MTNGRIENARRLRREDTPAERKLWSLLRNRKLEGHKFRRQVPIDRFFADFCCMESRLIVELDGSQHAEMTEYDTERTRILESLGFHVLRFWNGAVLHETEGVINTIRMTLDNAAGRKTGW